MASLRRGSSSSSIRNYINADEDLSAAQDDLNRMSRNLPFLREVSAGVEEIESIQDEMTE